MTLTPEQHKDQLTKKFLTNYTRFIKYQTRVLKRSYDQAHEAWMKLSIDDPQWPDGDEEQLRSYGIKSEYVAGIIRSCLQKMDELNELA